MKRPPPPFDPRTGEPVEQHLAAYPDAPRLILDDIRKHGQPDAGYRVARVPKTDVYIMYGIDEVSHTIRLVCIRTFRGATN